MSNLTIIGPTDGERVHFIIFDGSGVQDFRLDHDEAIERIGKDIGQGRQLVAIDEEHLYLQDGPSADFLVVGAMGQERLHLIRVESGKVTETRNEAITAHQELAEALTQGYSLLMASGGGRTALARPEAINPLASKGSEPVSAGIQQVTGPGPINPSVSKNLIVMHDVARHTHVYEHVNGVATLLRNLSKEEGHAQLAKWIVEGYRLVATVHDYLYLIK